MTDQIRTTDLRRALGVLVDLLATAAFQGGEIDGCDAQEALERAGLVVTRQATEEDAANSEYDVEPGEDWYELTDEAKACRRLAQEMENAE